MNILDKEIQDLGNLNLQTGGGLSDTAAAVVIGFIKLNYEQQYGMNFDWDANPEQDGWEGWHSFVLGGPGGVSTQGAGNDSVSWTAHDNLYEDTTSQYQPHRRLIL